jgi:hypothetical protein
MKFEKNTNISLRLEENLLQRIEYCATIDKESKSDFIRKALIDSTKYAEILPIEVPSKVVNIILKTLEPLQTIKIYHNEYSQEKIASKDKNDANKAKLNVVVKVFHDTQSMIFSSEIMKYILNELTPPQIEKIATKTFYLECKNIQSTLFTDLDFIDFISDQLLKDRKFILTFFYGLKCLTNEVFSTKGRKWFEKCQVTRSNDIVTFVGKHGAGKNFSHFFLHYYENIMAFIPNQRHEDPLLNEDSIKITHKLLIDGDKLFNLATIVKQIRKKADMLNQE